MAMITFADRVDAGRQLAARLGYLHGQDVVVLGLPRGGVPVAFEVAEALDAPLDVIVVRKLGVQFQPELAMGAIGEGGVRVLDAEVLARAQVTEEELRTAERRERGLLEARVARLRRGRERLNLDGSIAVIVDDGIATGSTARVACGVARRLDEAKVVLGVPVAPAGTVRDLTEADEVVFVSVPRRFMAVGNHYRDFSPTSDEEVIVLLDAAARRMRGGRAAGDGPDCDIDVEIPVGAVALKGHLHLPEPAAGVVLFAHGSGSSRHSPRNRFVADVLYQAGLGTLLLDLLTPQEELNRANVRAPTLLIVGSADEAVLKLNRQAQAQLRCPSQLAVVAGATHLFEEPGTLAEAAILASDWFAHYLLPAEAQRATGACLLYTSPSPRDRQKSR